MTDADAVRREIDPKLDRYLSGTVELPELSQAQEHVTLALINLAIELRTCFGHQGGAYAFVRMTHALSDVETMADFLRLAGYHVKNT